MAQVAIKRSSAKESKGEADIRNECRSVFGKTADVRPEACYTRAGPHRVPRRAPPARSGGGAGGRPRGAAAESKTIA